MVVPGDVQVPSPALFQEAKHGDGLVSQLCRGVGGLLDLDQAVPPRDLTGADGRSVRAHISGLIGDGGMQVVFQIQ